MSEMMRAQEIDLNFKCSNKNSKGAGKTGSNIKIFKELI
jgi:hypothetical protein